MGTAITRSSATEQELFDAARAGDEEAFRRLLGAAVPVEPREGPAGWRSVVTTPAAGEIALWQPKR